MDTLKRHASYGVSYAFDPVAIARNDALAAETHNPTPEGVALKVWALLDHRGLLDGRTLSTQVRQALVPLFEQVLTTIWSNGFDDGEAQMRNNIREILDDD